VPEVKPSRGQPVVEILRLAPSMSAALARFFQDLTDRGDDAFFAPHAPDERSISQMISNVESDLYYVAIDREAVLGYGLLRGWDEGFAVPSLGIAVHPSARGTGLAKLMMDFLHLAAARTGAGKVRLRVRQDNSRAVAMYRSLGYVFEESDEQSEYLVAFKALKPQHDA
jgi:[ribosomal protein S18]-alanine N-acetyltransferase